MKLNGDFYNSKKKKNVFFFFFVFVFFIGKISDHFHLFLKLRIFA